VQRRDTELGMLRTALAEKEAQWVAEMQHRDAELSTLRDALREQEALASRLPDALTEMQHRDAELSTLRDALREQEALVSRLSDALAELSTLRDALREQEALASRLPDALARVGVLEQAVKEGEEEARRLRESLSITQRELGEREAALAAFTRQSPTPAPEDSILEEKCRLAEERALRAEAAVAQGGERAEVLEGEIREFSSRLEAAVAAREEVVKEAEALRSEVARLRSELEAVVSARGKGEEDVAAAEGRAREQEESIKRLKVLLSKTRNALHAREQELNRTKQTPDPPRAFSIPLRVREEGPEGVIWCRILVTPVTPVGEEGASTHAPAPAWATEETVRLWLEAKDGEGGPTGDGLDCSASQKVRRALREGGMIMMTMMVRVMKTMMIMMMMMMMMTTTTMTTMMMC
jgi:DNA repair exonuclease SbcCD ATPase subunit